ncbi:MAG: gliding motility lipoprotein GldD [Bacteroidetes bacterium]|nr:MAG: gliding motility lipoprotein GldD [Bacteroidota bacterium]
MRFLIIILFSFFMINCADETVVKPAAKLSLEYPLQSYSRLRLDCPFSFAKNDVAFIEQKTNCGINIRYPKMKATLYLTYQRIKEDNLKALLLDAQKLTYDHTVKANEIFEQPRVDSINNVYGMFYIINGNAATQSQFYVTDSLNHFVTGSLYFEMKPNFDSIYPAVVYLRDDIRRIMETISWEE